MSDEDKTPGIKSFSVGFGPGLASARRALRPAPPYRLLVAGDFGLADEGARHRLAGGLAELLREAHPTIEVVVENLPGPFPVTVSQTIRLATLSDLRPAVLLRQLEWHKAPLDSVMGEAGLGDVAAQRYDRLAALVAPHRELPGARTAVDPAGGGDGLDSLFDMVDSPASRRGAKGNSPSDLISDFIADNIATPAGRRSASRQVPEAAEALLDAQAFAFLSHPRLRQVLENWYGLRLLYEAIARARGIEVTLLQIAVDSDASRVRERLAGADGALHEDLFDLLLLANRCTAKAGGAEMLRAAAEAADAFDIVALATLTADFAGVPADQLAAMDAPHQALAAAGYEAFNALRAQDVAKRLGIFWNDVLVVEGIDSSPELYAPAAWAAAAMALRCVTESGWPCLQAAAASPLSGFPVASRTLRGREVAVATHMAATDESISGLASAGIATLAGRLDRDSVHVARAPSFAAGKDKTHGASLDDRLVLARIGQLLQAVLPEVLGGSETPMEKASLVEGRFAEVVQSIPLSPRFDVSAAVDEGDPVLDIAVTLPQGVASSRRFEFQIAC